jgi:hypothetical protein
MANAPPGVFTTPLIAPVYVGGMPLDELAKALTTDSGLFSSQKLTAESQFWSTPRRAASDPMREVFEVNLSAARQINSVAFDLPRFPHKAYLFYLDTKTNMWKPVLNTAHQPLMVSIVDSLPAIITPAPPGSNTHAQHYGAGHWIHYEYALSQCTAAQFRLVVVRQQTINVPVDNARKAVPYSLGVRGFNIGFKIKGYTDIPYTNRNANTITERESFTSTTDILGSPVSLSVRENRAADLMGGAIWKSEPQPIPNAVVCLYVDARDSRGGPQVVDRFYIDPVTTGVHMNLYYSNDVPDQIDFVSNDNPLSFPMTRQFGAAISIEPAGLLFPDAVGYLDINNAGFQLNQKRPFWLGMVIQPQFNNTDTNRHVLLDTGTLRVEWTGSVLSATFAGVTVIRDDVVFSFNEQMSMALCYDGAQFHFYIHGTDRVGFVSGVVNPPLLPLTSTGMTALMRIGGLVTPAGGDPGHGHFRLLSLILKPEMSAGQDVYEQYFSDFSAFVAPSGLMGESGGAVNNTILRYDSAFQTLTKESLNQFGFVGSPGNRYENLVWTPVSRDFKLNKGYLVFNPTKAKYFKFEFTNLSAIPYDDYEPMVRKVQVFPTAQYYQSIIAPPVSASGNTAGGGAIVSQDAMSTLHYSDQVRLYTNTQVAQKDGSYAPTQALYSTSPLVQGRLRNGSLYFNLQAWHLSKFAPKFTEVAKHVYEHIEILHTQRLAYSVGLNAIKMIRVDYTTSDDTNQYQEMFQDTAHLAVDSNGNLPLGWVLGDDTPDATGGFLATQDNMGIGDTVTTASKVFPSKRKVTGIQFATQQTPPAQLLDDPDFNDTALINWQTYGDTTLTSSDVFTTDIGTMIKVQRNISTNFWYVIEGRWPSWDAIENSDPDVAKPTWDDLEIQTGEGGSGGVETAYQYDVSPVGRLYAAARVYATETLSAPLYIQIISGDGTVISEEPFTPQAGQVSEWFCSYTVGDGGTISALTWQQMEDGGLVPDGDPLHPTWDEMEVLGSWDQINTVSAALVTKVSARLVQVEPTDDVWFVDNISLYDDAIIWQFSNDSGITWYSVYDVRNDPHGAFMFPPSADTKAGLGLCWRAVGARPKQRVDSLTIRPFYDSLPLGQPYRETIQSFGPNQAMIDHYPPVTEDPRWKLWHKPIPEDWWFIFRQWLLQQRPPLDTAVYTVVSNAIVAADATPPSPLIIDFLVLPPPPPPLPILVLFLPDIIVLPSGSPLLGLFLPDVIFR